MFTVDGAPKQFDYLRAADNSYTPLASTVRARPSATAEEQLSITFLSIDLRKVEPPVELPLPRTAARANDPLVAMAGVGFSYTDEMGREWAGQGRVRVESFGADGTVEGTFADVSVPHTRKQLPNAVLTDGRFRVRFGGN